MSATNFIRSQCIRHKIQSIASNFNVCKGANLTYLPGVAIRMFGQVNSLRMTSSYGLSAYFSSKASDVHQDVSFETLETLKTLKDIRKLKRALKRKPSKPARSGGSRKNSRQEDRHLISTSLAGRNLQKKSSEPSRRRGSIRQTRDEEGRQETIPGMATTKQIRTFGRDFQSKPSKHANKRDSIWQKRQDLQQILQIDKAETKPKHQPLGPPFSLFVTCLPGLEPLLHEEIEYLRNSWQGDAAGSTMATTPQVIPGGVKLTVSTLAHVYILRLFLGTASHIYIRLNDDIPKRVHDSGTCAKIPPLFRARGFPEFERKLKDLIIAQEWNRWLLAAPKKRKGKAAPWNLHLHVTASKSKLFHTKAIEERVRNVIGEVLGFDLKDPEPDGNKPTIRILVRIERDMVQLSLDATSTPMHMRGYRKDPYKAPLREDLAFSLLMAGGMKPCWNLNPLSSLLGTSPVETNIKQPKVHLFDPCCGSGTIPIEGAGILAGLPPGRSASAPLQGTSFCHEGLWKDILDKTLSVSALENEQLRKKVMVTANDAVLAAVNAAKQNAEEGGVLDLIEFTRGPFQKHDLFLRPPPRKAPQLLMVTNPPYGQRLSPSGIYGKLAKSITYMPDERKSIRYAMMGIDPRPMRETGLPMGVSFSSKSGGLSVVAMSGERSR